MKQIEELSRELGGIQQVSHFPPPRDFIRRDCCSAVSAESVCDRRVSEFALRFGIRPRQAYAYMKRYKGMEHFHNYYGILHTQSFSDTVEVLAQVCQNNGGGLR